MEPLGAKGNQNKGINMQARAAVRVRFRMGDNGVYRIEAPESFMVVGESLSGHVADVMDFRDVIRSACDMLDVNPDLYLSDATVVVNAHGEDVTLTAVLNE